MRVLIDECLPRVLTQQLTGHDVKTVPQAGWAGKHNGELLRLAEGQFDVLVTVDKSIPSQQNVAKLKIAVIILRARSNRLEDVEPFVSAILQALPHLAAGTVVVLDPP